MHFTKFALLSSIIISFVILGIARGDEPKAATAEQAAVPPTYKTIDQSIAKGDLDDVRRHVAMDPQNAKKGGRETSRPPLEQAILRKKTDIAIYLISAGADPNSVNASKRTPLHLAVERNSPEIVAVLIKAGANPDVLDKDGWTPLHHAAAKDQLETARELIAGGADPKTLSQLGGTPLHEAACSGGKEIILFLLEQEIDPSVKSKEGVTALDIAKQYKNEAAIEVLSGL